MFSTSFLSVFPHYPVYESHLWADPIPHSVVRSLEELDLVAQAVIAHAQQSTHQDPLTSVKIHQRSSWILHFTLANEGWKLKAHLSLRHTYP